MGEICEHRTAVVIEDDDDVRELLGSVLSQAGFTVHAAATGSAGVELVREHDPLVTTLDLSLPDIDGFEVARRLRIFSVTYLVMLTARTEEIDALMGLELGADDYMTKPFRARELRARVGAMLRRPRHLVRAAPAGAPGPVGSAGVTPAGAALPGPSFLPVAGPSATAVVAAGAVAGAPVAPRPRRAEATPAAAAADVPGASGVGGVATSVVVPAPEPAVPGPVVITHRGLQLHVAAHRAVLDGADLHLTPSEFSLLAALLGSPRRVVSKAELSRHLWGEGVATSAALGDAERRTVEVHIANLRRKLSDDASNPRFIETVRGVGYRLAWRR